MVHTYETLFICPGDASQEKVEAALEKVKTIITRSDGKIVTAELWGKRKLSYPIDHNREGFYGYLIFSASATTPALLDRHYQVTDQILRGLTVKVDPRHLEKIRPQFRPTATETQETAAPASSATKHESQSPEAAAPSSQSAPSENPPLLN